MIFSQLKKTANLILEFVKEDFNLKYYLYNAIFLSVCIWLNYGWGYEEKMLEYLGNNPLNEIFFFTKYKRNWIAYPIYWFHYFYPYILTMIGFVMVYGRREFTGIFTNKAFLRISIMFVMMMIYVSFYHHTVLIETHLPWATWYWCKITANNFVSAILMFTLTLAYWFIFEEDRSSRLYGFTKQNVSMVPYFIMVVLMVPLIAYASFQPDFQKTYPVYMPHYLMQVWDVEEWWLVAAFEVNYGLDFIATELFFRGLLVIGLSRYLGRHAVVPMVTCYCVFHFGKPLGEALSSIFGGYILGILAYKTRSIYGGIIIHLAIAYMMEIGGFLGNNYLKVE